MRTTTSIFIILTIVAVCIYTVSYGIWSWKKNRIGGIAVFSLAASIPLLTIYAIFFKTQ